MAVVGKVLSVRREGENIIIEVQYLEGVTEVSRETIQRSGGQADQAEIVNSIAQRCQTFESAATRAVQLKALEGKSINASGAVLPSEGSIE